jgi:hypothetical protein
MKFRPGESGNPSGRKPGTGYRQQLFKTLIEPRKNELINTALELALDGNEAMLRLFLERMLPCKPVDDGIVIEVPESDTQRMDALLLWGDAVLQATSNGEITPEQGKAIMALIEAQRKNIEATDLALRLAEIERTLKQRKKEK